MSAFPKPDRKPRARVTRELKHYYQHASARVCIICRQAPAELHHVTGGVSAKTGLPLQRRSGAARALFVPLCRAHHREGPNSVHELGERTFERHHGKPEGWLLGIAAASAAAFITGGDS